MKEENYHAWYSETAVIRGVGTTFWRREDGSEVEVTNVHLDKNGFYGFEDKQYLGEVVEFVRSGRPSLYQCQ